MDNNEEVDKTVEQHDSVFAKGIPVQNSTPSAIISTFDIGETRGLSNSANSDARNSKLPLNTVQSEGYSNPGFLASSSNTSKITPKTTITMTPENKQKLINVASSNYSSSKLMVLPTLGELRLKVIRTASSQLMVVRPRSKTISEETSQANILKSNILPNPLPLLPTQNVVSSQNISLPSETISFKSSLSTSADMNSIPQPVSITTTSDKLTMQTTSSNSNQCSRKNLILKPTLNSQSLITSAHSSGKIVPIFPKSSQFGTLTSVSSSIKIPGLPSPTEQPSISNLSSNLHQTKQASSINASGKNVVSSTPILYANTPTRPSSDIVLNPTKNASSMGRVFIPPTNIMKAYLPSSSSETLTSGSSTAKSKAASKPVQSNLCLVVPTYAAAVADVTLEASCKVLASVKHPGRKSAYNDILKLLMDKHEDIQFINKLKAKVLPIALYDIKNLSSDVEMDGALEFLGNFLQVCKLESVTEDSVIKTLTMKILKTTSKLESKKAMWCLAHVDYRADIPNELLITMLSSALLYLSECPPIPSLGTVCEGLNVIQHMYRKSPQFILTDMEDILKHTFPLLFHETTRVRELALAFLQPLAPAICEEKLLGDSFQEKYRSSYHPRMLLLIRNEATKGLMLWRFLVEAFGDALHTNNQLINDLLKVEELALKSNNFDFRLCALQSWRCLISCFSRNPALISQKKRLKLLMVPFTSSESKTASLARTKIELWWHVLECLGAKAVDFSGDVTLVCLNFCFGGRNHPRGAVDAYPSLISIAAASLIGILSPTQSFDKWDFKRSVHFISMDGFLRHREEIFYVCERALINLEGDTNSDLFESLVFTFMERCSQVDSDVDASLTIQQAEMLTDYLIGLPESKPTMGLVVLSCFLHLLDNPIFFQTFVKKLKRFFKWPYSFDSKFPIDMYEEVIDKFYEIGTGVSSESNSFVQKIAICLETVKNEMTSSIFKLTLARQWSRLVKKILTLVVPDGLPEFNSVLFFFPMSIVNEMRCNCEELWETWLSYLQITYQQDSSIVRQLYNKAVDLFASHGSVVALMQMMLKFVIKALSSAGFVWPEFVDEWIANWTKSWINCCYFSRGVSKKNASMVEVMSDFLSFLIEDVSENLQLKISHIIALQIRAAIGSSDKYKDIQLIIEKNVFQKTGLSCTHFFEEGCTTENPAKTNRLWDPTVSYQNLIENAQNPVTSSEDNATEMSTSSSAASMDIHLTEASEADIMDMTAQLENNTSFDVEEKFFVGSVADFGLDEDHNSVDQSSSQLCVEQDSCIRIVDVKGGTQLSTSSSPDSTTRKRKATHDSELCCAEEASETSGEMHAVERRRSSRPPKPAKWRKLASEHNSDEDGDVFNYEWLPRKPHSPSKVSSPNSTKDSKNLTTFTENGTACTAMEQMNPSTLELINGDPKLRCHVKVLLQRIDF